jgi:uncharacterized phage protein (TIGR01671 family)
MREILFKAKRVDNGEWVEGYYLRDQYHIGGKDIIFYRKDSDRFTVYTNIIDIETLCQFTGLYDKNGNKIWENDICDRKEKYPEVVKMTNGDWTLDYSYAIGRDYGNSYCNLGFYVNERKCVEVIGNIFDNPELLQEVPE